MISRARSRDLSMVSTFGSGEPILVQICLPLGSRVTAAKLFTPVGWMMT